MPAQVSDELRDFHQFLSAKLKDSHIDWSPEEAVDEWRRLHPDSQAAAADIAAIDEALTDMVNGDQGFPSRNSTATFANGTTCQANHEPHASYPRTRPGKSGGAWTLR